MSKGRNHRARKKRTKGAGKGEKGGKGGDREETRQRGKKKYTGLTLIFSAMVKSQVISAISASRVVAADFRVVMV